MAKIAFLLLFLVTLFFDQCGHSLSYASCAVSADIEPTDMVQADSHQSADSSDHSSHETNKTHHSCVVCHAHHAQVFVGNEDVMIQPNSYQLNSAEFFYDNFYISQLGSVLVRPPIA